MTNPTPSEKELEKYFNIYLEVFKKIKMRESENSYFSENMKVIIRYA